MNTPAADDRYRDAGYGLYVHLPFCTSRCDYCTFVSSIYHRDTVDAYLTALREEIALRNLSALGLPKTLFLGGGTPSSLSLQQLEKLVSFLPFPKDGGEASCELNPESVEREKLLLLKQAGITRCSFGVQTFAAEGLRLLGRRHSAKEAAAAVALAVELAFLSVSVDLIAAWPGQRREQLLYDLRESVGLGIKHLSCYNLLVEPGARLAVKMLRLGLREKDDEEAADFWNACEGYLESVGFEHYETSNYARPGWQCRHNVDIWQGKEYFGIGAGAHSYFRGCRFANTSDISEYIEKVDKGILPEVYSEILSPEERARECAVFWLRLFAGIDREEFFYRTGYKLDELYTYKISYLMRQGWLRNSDDGKKLFVPKKYQPVLDSILVELV